MRDGWAVTPHLRPPPRGPRERQEVPPAPRGAPHAACVSHTRTPPRPALRRNVYEISHLELPAHLAFRGGGGGGLGFFSLGGFCKWGPPAQRPPTVGKDPHTPRWAGAQRTTQSRPEPKTEGLSAFACLRPRLSTRRVRARTQKPESPWSSVREDRPFRSPPPPPRTPVPASVTADGCWWRPATPVLLPGRRGCQGPGARTPRANRGLHAGSSCPHGRPARAPSRRCFFFFPSLSVNSRWLPGLW